MINRLVPSRRWFFSPVPQNNTNSAPEPEDLWQYSARDYKNASGETIGIAYHRDSDEERKNQTQIPDFIDFGNCIAFPKKPGDNAIASAMELFQHKHTGKSLQLTGDHNFCESAAISAVAHGNDVSNPELREYVDQLQEHLSENNVYEAPPYV